MRSEGGLPCITYRSINITGWDGRLPGTGVRLTGVRLMGVRLTGVRLAGVRLTGVRLDPLEKTKETQVR